MSARKLKWKHKWKFLGVGIDITDVQLWSALFTPYKSVRHPAKGENRSQSKFESSSITIYHLIFSISK